MEQDEGESFPLSCFPIATGRATAAGGQLDGRLLGGGEEEVLFYLKKIALHLD